MARSLRDRLRGLLATDGNVETVRETVQEDAVDPETPTDVRTTQSPERPPSTPAVASHVPDAALGFDPWGHESTSYDSPGAVRRWIEAMLGQQQPE